MRLAVIIRNTQKEGLPTAAELRLAGFAVSTALRPDGGPGGTDIGVDIGAEFELGFGSGGQSGPDGIAPERAGPGCLRPPERQRP